MKKDAIPIVHDWDYPFYGRKYALKGILRNLFFLIFPRTSRIAYEEEVKAFQDLEYLLGITSKFYPRPRVLKEYCLAHDIADGVHYHPREGDLCSPFHKVWKPGIGLHKQENWKLEEIQEKIAMDLPRREITDKTEILDVHVKPERDSLYHYVWLLAEMKRKGIKWK